MFGEPVEHHRIMASAAWQLQHTGAGRSMAVANPRKSLGCTARRHPHRFPDVDADVAASCNLLGLRKDVGYCGVAGDVVAGADIER